MNIQQQSFITEYLRTGDKIQSYKNAYNSESTNYNSLESAANRLMRMPEIVNTIQAIQNSIRAEVEAELRAQLKQELLSIQQKRELLAQIATGQMIAEQHYKGKNCSQCAQYIKPTINQMLKAIDLDNKLAGHYAHQKKQEPVHSFKHRNLSHASGGGFADSLSRKGGRGGTIAIDAMPEKSASQQNKETPLPITHTSENAVELKNEENTTNHNKFIPTKPLPLIASAVKNEKQQHPDSYRGTTNNPAIPVKKRLVAES